MNDYCSQLLKKSLIKRILFPIMRNNHKDKQGFDIKFGNCIESWKYSFQKRFKNISFNPLNPCEFKFSRFQSQTKQFCRVH